MATIMENIYDISYINQIVVIQKKKKTRLFVLFVVGIYLGNNTLA